MYVERSVRLYLWQLILISVEPKHLPCASINIFHTQKFKCSSKHPQECGHETTNVCYPVLIQKNLIFKPQFGSDFLKQKTKMIIHLTHFMMIKERLSKMSVQIIICSSMSIVFTQRVQLGNPERSVRLYSTPSRFNKTDQTMWKINSYHCFSHEAHFG